MTWPDARARRLGLTPGNLRQLRRENRQLHSALGAMLDEAEASAITSFWPHGDHPPGEPRLCRILADEMRYGDDDFAAWDLKLIKQARRALGLPEWWKLE